MFPFLRGFLFLSGLLLLAVNSYAAAVYGVVADAAGKPLPFANVYIQGTTIGTTTNEQGRYRLELEEGVYELVFHYVGYQRKHQLLTIARMDVELNVSLGLQEVSLNEVVVSATEDPAYAIIRKAIERRRYHLNQVQSYKCQAYVKGLQRIISAPDKILGQEINASGILDSNNTGIVYLSESISDFYFQRPDKVKEVMISSKLSGDSQTFSWNRAGDISVFDFYDNNLDADLISDRVFISPLSDNALFFYRYRLEGVFEEDGRLINKIEVIPRRNSDPVFRGYIYIVDNEWNLYSLYLYLTKDAQLNYVDTLHIHQTYVPVKDDIWMPISKRFDFVFQVLSIRVRGYYVAVYKDYELEPELKKGFFTNELLKIEKEANEKDETYWQENRPVPLTEEETQDYERKEKLEELQESEAYMDSLDKKLNRFDLMSGLLGYTYYKSAKDLSISFSSLLLQTVQYNTVEGLNLRMKVDISKEWEKRRTLIVSPVVRYGFSNGHFNAKANVRYYYDPLKYALLSLDAGQYVYQFNGSEPISDLVNTAYTLLWEANYMKLYEERFAKLAWRTEVVNGLMLMADATYGQRFTLHNTTNYGWVDREGVSYTANVPDNALFQDAAGNTLSAPVDHEEFVAGVALRWKPGQKYISRPDAKFVFGSKYPSFSASYRKSLPGVFGSDLNFDLLEVGIFDERELGLLGNLFFTIRGGSFLNKQRVAFADYKHFTGNRTIIGRNYDDGFQLLDYYTASTTDDYIEGHLQHHFDGFIFNKIPLVRKLKLQAVLSLHSFYTDSYGGYMEVGTGVENIFKVGRIDLFQGFGSRQSSRYGIRLGIDLGQL